MTSPDSASAVAQEHDGAVLRIVSGLHAGASRPLSRREMVLIGSGDDCDVVLADDEVAAHHALLNIVDGRFHLRALDAPVKLPDRTLYPGDPVEISQVQRIGVGEAAIAFGQFDDPEWLAIAPDAAVGDFTSPERPRVPFAKRLPLIAGIAVVALAGLAIAAGLMPARKPEIDVEQRLRQLAGEYQVSDVRITRDVDGHPVLAGTVPDRASRDRFRAQLEAEELRASATLRTGEDLASDVAEVMRTGGYSVKAEYLGDNNVRVTGRLGGNASELRAFIQSRAMRETGVNRVEPVDLDGEVVDGGDVAAPAERKARIVSIVRGDDPHLVDADGVQYRDGATVPGWGKLVSFGVSVHALKDDGSLVKVEIEPVEPAAAADAGTPAPAGTTDNPSMNTLKPKQADNAPSGRRSTATAKPTRT